MKYNVDDNTNIELEQPVRRKLFFGGNLDLKKVQPPPSKNMFGGWFPDETEWIKFKNNHTS